MPKHEEEKEFAAVVLWLMGQSERRIASRLMMRRGAVMAIVREKLDERMDIVTRQRALDQLRAARVAADGSLRDGGRLPDREWTVSLGPQRR